MGLYAIMGMLHGIALRKLCAEGNACACNYVLVITGQLSIMKNFWEQLEKPFISLAPMAGVSDQAFRRICKEYGADVIYTEFASANALVRNSKKTLKMLAFNQEEQPVVCQIFGNNPENFFKSAKILEELGFSGIDINFGCPAYKVVKTGGGVSLMRNLGLCFELAQAVCEGGCLPVSVKIRSSINPKPKEQEKQFDMGRIESSDNKKPITALDFVKKIKPLPVSAIMIHARSYEAPFDGKPDLLMIKKVRKIWDRALIANGGINTPVYAKEILEQTKADGIGLARGAWGKPWLFKQIKDYLKTGAYEPFTNFEQIKKAMIHHAELALSTKGDHGIIEMRKHLGWYVKGLCNAKQLRSKLVRAGTIDEIKKILTFF